MIKRTYIIIISYINRFVNIKNQLFSLFLSTHFSFSKIKNKNKINFDLAGSVGDALGELLGKSSPNPSKPFNNILFKLRRFIKPHRVAPALSPCYRVASHSTQQTHLQWRYSDKERGILKGERIAKNSAIL